MIFMIFMISIIFIMLGLPLISIIVIQMKDYLEKTRRLYLSENFINNLMQNLENKIRNKTEKINEEIRIAEIEISAIPKIDDFKDMIEIKKRVLQNLREKKELIIQNEISKFINKFPVLIAASKNSIKDIEIISKNKNLMSMYKLLIKNNFKKDKFLFLVANGKLEKFIKQISKSKYENYFKNSINILNLTGKELIIEPEFYNKYVNIINIKKGE